MVQLLLNKCGCCQYIYRCAGGQFLSYNGKVEVRTQRENQGKYELMIITCRPELLGLLLIISKQK